MRRVQRQYGEHVRLQLEVPAEQAQALRARLNDLGHGQLRWLDEAH